MKLFIAWVVAVSGASLSVCLFAADGVPQSTDLVPGTKCTITVELECEVKEVDKDTVQVTVVAIEEGEQGVPVCSNLPHLDRLFKNVGVGRRETKAIVPIPKDRIKQIRSDNDRSVGGKDAEPSKSSVFLCPSCCSNSRHRRLGLTMSTCFGR